MTCGRRLIRCGAIVAKTRSGSNGASEGFGRDIGVNSLHQFTEAALVARRDVMFLLATADT